MLGLRTASSDKAVGMGLSLSPGKMARRMRGTLGDPGPIGVSCLSDDPDGTVSPLLSRILLLSGLTAFSSP